METSANSLTNCFSSFIRCVTRTLGIKQAYFKVNYKITMLKKKKLACAYVAIAEWDFYGIIIQ